MNDKKEHLIGLDFIRIFACIVILLYHLGISSGGFLLVCTFFTLSGYLSCYSAFNNKDFSLKKYYKNLFTKFYIPLLVVVSITLIIAKLIPNLVWLNLKPETTSVIFGYNNFWQLFTNQDYFTKNVNSPFMHFWYIAILFQFRLIFPLLLKFCKNIDNQVGKHTSTVFLGIFAAASTLYFYRMSLKYDIMSVYCDTFTRFFSIIFGILLAVIHRKYNFKISNKFINHKKLVYIFYFILLTFLCKCVSINADSYALYMILATIISVRLIEYSTYKPAKDFKFITSLANITYEIYLVQYPILFYINNTNLSDNLKIIITIILTFIFAIILHFLTAKKFTKKIINYIKTFIITAIIAIGGIIFANEKDHTEEMKELETRLTENQKIIEQNYKEYVSNLNKEKENLDSILESINNDESLLADKVAQLHVVGVGDSVMLGAVNKLYKKFPNGYFDGKVSRSIPGGTAVLNDLIANDQLEEIVVIALATNGYYSEKQNQKLLDTISEKQVYWVNTVGGVDSTFNSKFEEYAKDKPNIHIVKWDEASKTHPEYFYADGIHLKDSGSTAYAETIFNTIYNEYLKEYTAKKEELLAKFEKERKEKIAFYGNDLMTNAVVYLNSISEKSIFNTYDNFNDVYNEISFKKQNDNLENRIVFMFDKNTEISKENYEKLLDLCQDQNIIICNLTPDELVFEKSNVFVIDFQKMILENKDLELADKIHLSEAGNMALANLILKKLEN